MGDDKWARKGGAALVAWEGVAVVVFTGVAQEPNVGLRAVCPGAIGCSRGFVIEWEPWYALVLLGAVPETHIGSRQTHTLWC